MRIMKLVVVALLFSFASVQAQADVCASLYEHEKFGGDTLLVFSNQSMSNIGDLWNDRISSVQVTPGCHITLFEHINFAGSTHTLWGNSDNIGYVFNDQASSFDCYCD